MHAQSTTTTPVLPLPPPPSPQSPSTQAYSPIMHSLPLRESLPSIPIPTSPHPPSPNAPRNHPDNNDDNDDNDDEWIDIPQAVSSSTIPLGRRIVPVWHARAYMFYERLYNAIGIPINKITIKDADDHLPFQSGSAFDDWFLSCGSIPFAIERAWTLVDTKSRIVDIALMWGEAFTIQFASLCANVHKYMRIEFAPNWRFATAVWGNAAWLELSTTRKQIDTQLKWFHRDSGVLSSPIDNSAFDYILESNNTTTITSTPSDNSDVIVISTMKARVQEAIGTKQLPASIEVLVNRYDEQTESRYACVLAVIHACAVYRLNGRIPHELTRETRALLAKRRALLESTALDAGTELASIITIKNKPTVLSS